MTKSDEMRLKLNFLGYTLRHTPGENLVLSMILRTPYIASSMVEPSSCFGAASPEKSLGLLFE